MDKIIEIKSISKTFKLSRKQRMIDKTNDKYKVAVNSLSLTAYKKEIYGLLGPNGAGKTTTLRIMSTLIKPDKGDIFINGISVKNNPGEIRKQIGFLTSELKLEEFFTPSYLFDYYSNLHGLSIEDRNKRKKILFDKFQVDKFAEVKVGELSTGMKQKASLAISLVHDPDIIIFDEPTNGLDIITAKVITDYLLELKEEGKTIIISSHIFSLIEKICDRVGIIINGKMVKEGLLDEVKNGKQLEDAFFDYYLDSVGENHE